MDPHPDPRPERGSDASAEVARKSGQFLPKLALHRPVTVCMFFLALLVLGAIAYLEIPRQLFPSGFTPPFLYVYLPSRPAPPRAGGARTPPRRPPRGTRVQTKRHPPVTQRAATTRRTQCRPQQQLQQEWRQRPS